MAGSDTRIVRITGSKAWAAGKMQFDLDFLPAGYRIVAAVLELTGTLNVPAAGVTVNQLDRLLDSIEQGRRLRTDGLGSKALDWAVNSKEFARPAAIAVGVAQPFAGAWAISWKDPRFEDMNDAPPATDFYKGQTLDVYWKTPTDILAALAVNAGTNAQVVFFLEKLSVGTVPSSIVIGYVEYTGKDIKLPAGEYHDVIIRKLDGAAITEAELGNVQLSEDDAFNVLERTRLPQLVRSWNRYVASGPALSDGGATSGAEGQSLDEASVQFAPIVHPMPGQKGTRLPTAHRMLHLVIDGTLAVGSARVYYRFNEHRDEANILKAGAKIYGAANLTGELAPKTSSKNGVSPVRGVLSALAQRVGLRGNWTAK